MNITEKQRLMGHGIMVMIENHYKELQKYTTLMESIFEPDEKDLFSSTICDMVYGDDCYDFDQYANNLGLKVVENND